MAMDQQIIDRYKATGFYRHVEWNRRWGVLIKIYDQTSLSKSQKITFEVGVYDVDYDQRLDGFRQFWLSRKDAVKFMLNMEMTIAEIAQTFKQIDGCQVVTKYT